MLSFYQENEEEPKKGSVTGIQPVAKSLNAMKYLCWSHGRRNEVISAEIIFCKKNKQKVINLSLTHHTHSQH